MDMLATAPPASACLLSRTSAHSPLTIATSTAANSAPASVSAASPCHSPFAARRPQAGCTEPEADEGDVPRPRLSREQVLMLEKQFSENPKPTAAARWAVAQRTGLSMQRVGNWFQNRRVKAKQQKKQEEMQVMQVLESAGRRRMTEPSPSSSSSSSSTLCLPTEMSSSKTFKTAAGRRRAKSESATARLNTRSSGTALERPDFSPYASPTEASYASLARSLAQAAAAMRQANLNGGFNEYTHDVPKPGVTFNVDLNSAFALQGLGSDASGIWQQPMSAFSDWGSSRSSIVAYTPTPAGQTEDPFEFDNTLSDHNSQPGSVIHSSGVPATEDFDMFAEAIKQNQSNRPFVMPAFPSSSLMKRRQMSPLCAEPQNTSSLPSPPLVDGHEAGQPEFSAFINTQRLSLSSPSDSGSSIAARRHQEGPSFLDSNLSSSMPVRSKSFNGTLSTMDEDVHEDEPTRRSVPSTAQDLQRMGTDFTSPFNLNIFSSAPAFSSKLRQSSGPPPDYSSNSDMDEYSAMSPSSYTLQERMPDFGFTDSATPESATFSVTPESATFDNSIISSLPPTMIQDNHSVYRMHLPDHQQLFKHNGYVPYYDFPSEGSSASSGILFGKETNAFPFEDFLTARYKAKAVHSLGGDEGY